MSSIFPIEKVVRGNLTKPRNADFSGRYHGDQPIYVEKEPIYGEPAPVLDNSGEPVRKHWNNGRSRTLMKRPIIGHRTREYVIEDLGNGITPKNYHFAASAEELTRNAAIAQTQPEHLVAFMSKMDRVIEKLGLTPEDLDALAGEPEKE